MEEIDIIELLKRVKEGKAPKKIEIMSSEYERDDMADDIDDMYRNKMGRWIYNERITPDTKIKILDKPIIEELDDTNNVDIFDLARKVNEIIRYINNN